VFKTRGKRERVRQGEQRGEKKKIGCRPPEFIFCEWRVGKKWKKATFQKNEKRTGNQAGGVGRYQKEGEKKRLSGGGKMIDKPAKRERTLMGGGRNTSRLGKKNKQRFSRRRKKNCDSLYKSGGER